MLHLEEKGRNRVCALSYQQLTSTKKVDMQPIRASITPMCLWQGRCTSIQLCVHPPSWCMYLDEYNFTNIIQDISEGSWQMLVIIWDLNYNFLMGGSRTAMRGNGHIHLLPFFSPEFSLGQGVDSGGPCPLGFGVMQKQWIYQSLLWPLVQVTYGQRRVQPHSHTPLGSDPALFIASVLGPRLWSPRAYLHVIKQC